MSRTIALEAVSRAELCAALLALCPTQLGGIVIRAQNDSLRDAWVTAQRQLLPQGHCWRRVPANISQDRLLGGIDFSATLQSGAPVYTNGLLAECDGGTIEIAMAERMDVDRAALIAAAIDRAEVGVRESGANLTSACRVSVVAMDEGLDADEILDPAIADRLALQLGCEDLKNSGWSQQTWSRAKLARAKSRLVSVTIADDIVRSLAATSVALGIKSLRGDLFAIRAARALAALARRTEATEQDAALAAQLVLAHRAQYLPADADSSESTDSDSSASDAEQEGQKETRPEELDDRVLDAAKAAIPAHLLSDALDFRRARGASGGRGRAGKMQQGRKTGRVVGAMPAERTRDDRLHLLATLRAALPWQAMRRSAIPDDKRSSRILFEKSDLQVSRRKDRNESTTIFVVDASGSQAAQRLGEVKGAIELLIADCYVRRDQVALVAFRKRQADILLAPTRALARAKRALAELPGGGGTPLAAGVDKAALLVDAVRRQGRTPKVVFLTDGRANVSRDGTEGHAEATAEALHAARMFRSNGLRPIVIDTSRRPRPAAREFAAAMAAAYVPLPQASAASINSVVAKASA